MSAFDRFFQLEQHGTTVSREVIAGLTTFTTMSYIVVVNPAILSHAAFLLGPVLLPRWWLPSSAAR
jgi:AGZA family xanthine/uracil permease-like MFS transporter